jgi:hypothetical protein
MNLIKKILPSRKVNKDIDLKYNKIDYIKPISLNNFTLIYPIEKEILKLRKQKSVLNIERLFKNMALIIPYRNRKEHLEKFIPYITDYLNKQNINFEIIIVEQVDTKPFNRAKLLNIGAIYASSNIDYFVFHDIDLLPENIDYRYCNYSLKPFTFIENYDGQCREYQEKTYGGVTIVPKKVFFDINGFSNNYQQWGSEDDDFHMRHLLKGHMTLYDTKGKLKNLGHPSSLTRDVYGNYVKEKSILKQNKKLRKKNKQRFSLLKRGIIKQDDDGVTQLQKLQISIEKISKLNYLLLRVTF